MRAMILPVFLLLPAALAAQAQAYVVRLGNDTLAVEQFTRTGNEVRGEQVVRGLTTARRSYTIALNDDGSVRRFEMVTQDLGAGPRAARTRATIETTGDTAVVNVPRGDSIVTARVGGARTAVPWVMHTYALVELLARQAQARPEDSVGLAAVSLGGRELVPVSITRAGERIFRMMIGPIGPWTVRLDTAGQLAGLGGAGSTVQVRVQRVAPFDMRTMASRFATRPLGPLSPNDTVTATVGAATVTVRYARPSTRGRVIFGGVVPWDQVWRTGANAATLFQTSADLVFGETVVPAGDYTLWTIPRLDGWTLIINRNTGQWGTEYAQEHDLVRLPMEVSTLAEHVELFTIAIEATGAGGALALRWAETEARVNFTVR